MTKQEKINALIREGAEENTKLHAELYPEFVPPTYEKLTHFRLELEENKHVLEAYDYSIECIKRAFRQKISEPGVYHLYFHMERESDYDHSEEGKAKREKVDKAKHELNCRLQERLKAIENEPDNE